MLVNLDNFFSLGDLHGPEHCENKISNERCNNISNTVFFSEEDYEKLLHMADQAAFNWIRDESRGIVLCPSCQKLKMVIKFIKTV